LSQAEIRAFEEKAGEALTIEVQETGRLLPIAGAALQLAFSGIGHLH